MYAVVTRGGCHWGASGTPQVTQEGLQWHPFGDFARSEVQSGLRIGSNVLSADNQMRQSYELAPQQGNSSWGAAQLTVTSAMEALPASLATPWLGNRSAQQLRDGGSPVRSVGSGVKNGLSYPSGPSA